MTEAEIEAIAIEVLQHTEDLREAKVVNLHSGVKKYAAEVKQYSIRFIRTFYPEALMYFI